MECLGDGMHNDQIAKLTAALRPTQRGAVLLYYGEDIGMATVPTEQLSSVPTAPKRPIYRDEPFRLAN